MENRKLKKMLKDLSPTELFEAEKRLSTYAGEDRVIPSQELSDELKKNTDSDVKIYTGFQTLDRLTKGIELGELVVVTGLSGQGKTTLTMSLTQNIAENGFKSVWFTLEVTPKQFIAKMEARTKKTPEFYIPRENLDNTLNWIEEKIVESNVKYGTHVVFIDHLNMIFSLDRMNTGNVSLEIGDLAAKIKNIALKHNQAIFLIAHCKDPVDNKEPTERSIRDSGMIVRLADIVMGVWRVKNSSEPDVNRLEEIEEEDTQAKVRIWKNRREGKLGKFFVDHKDHYFFEIEKKSQLDKLTDSLKKPKLYE
jgi:replicative DNA helicase